VQCVACKGDLTEKGLLLGQSALWQRLRDSGDDGKLQRRVMTTQAGAHNDSNVWHLLGNSSRTAVDNSSSSIPSPTARRLLWLFEDKGHRRRVAMKQIDGDTVHDDDKKDLAYVEHTGFLPWEKQHVFDRVIQVRCAYLYVSCLTVRVLSWCLLVLLVFDSCVYIIEQESHDSYDVSQGYRSRHLLDTFADSLRHVNRVYNRAFGFQPRKVRASVCCDYKLSFS
jgi:hypothetical protein